MDSHRALAIGIASILASFHISSARAASLWDHNGRSTWRPLGVMLMPPDMQTEADAG
jgi:hypothetical protein